MRQRDRERKGEAIEGNKMTTRDLEDLPVFRSPFSFSFHPVMMGWEVAIEARVCKKDCDVALTQAAAAYLVIRDSWS